MRSLEPSRDRKYSRTQFYIYIEIFLLLFWCSETVQLRILLCFLFFYPNFLCRYEFFNELYHRFLLTPKVAMKCLCLQALTIVYSKCCEEIGPFTDTKYIVGMLDRVSYFILSWSNMYVYRPFVLISNFTV